MRSSFRLAALALLAHGACHAATPASDADALLATLRQKYPATTFTSVAPAQVKGIFEVVMGRKIAYTDRTARYFMVGSLVDMQTNDNLTAARSEELTRVDFSRLPLQDAIVRVNGNGRRKIVVFSDPDCPFCRRLEPELDKLEDATLYIFLYPIDVLHPDANRKSQAIWCRADNDKRLEAWHHAVTGADNPATADCDNPVKRNVALGNSLGVTGTPTLVAADGRVLPGMLPAAGIEEWLAKTKAVVSAK